MQQTEHPDRALTALCFVCSLQIILRTLSQTWSETGQIPVIILQRTVKLYCVDKRQNTAYTVSERHQTAIRAWCIWEKFVDTCGYSCYYCGTGQNQREEEGFWLL